MVRIGVIDSGLGGELVGKRVREKLGEVEIFQYKPASFISYSSSSLEQLFIKCKTHIEYLEEKDVELIIVGCMTLSTNCLQFITESSKVPVLDLYTVLGTLDNEWAIIATENTIRSGKFAHCKEIPCGTLSSIIENKNTLPYFSYRKVFKDTLKNYIKNSEVGDITKLILGCSHYPLEKELILSVLDKDVEILDPIEKLLEIIK